MKKKKEPLWIICEDINIKWYSHCRTQPDDSYKYKNYVWLSNSAHNNTPKKTERKTQKDTCTPMFLGAILTTAKM